ncbi:hypothetical protein JG687_00016039 [Phytophthora cactorum]|uniref:Uncharacterized protein n=1 Tax=Phytophthora cactorum TaxID=29920 RepID=A0A8T1TUB5_9STRA|nr:hypothetical protein JG687_00016039 [Phytophthora cactorum]
MATQRARTHSHGRLRRECQVLGEDARHPSRKRRFRRSSAAGRRGDRRDSRQTRRSRKFQQRGHSYLVAGSPAIELYFVGTSGLRRPAVT